MINYKSIYTPTVIEDFINQKIAFLVQKDNQQMGFIMRRLGEKGIKWVTDGNPLANERCDNVWKSGLRYIRINDDGFLTSGTVDEFSQNKKEGQVIMMVRNGELVPMSVC